MKTEIDTLILLRYGEIRLEWEFVCCLPNAVRVRVLDLVSRDREWHDHELKAVIRELLIETELGNPL